MVAISGTIAALGTAAATTAGSAASATGGLLAGAGGLAGVASVAGAGASIYGTVQANEAAQRQAEIQKDIVKTEEQGAKIEAARARRAIVRDTLRAQAMSEVAAGAGGALMGSGVAGGIAQAANSGMQSTRDVNQNLGMAQNMAGFKMQQANAQADQAQGNMIASIGAGLQNLSKSAAQSQTSAQRVYGPLTWLYGR